MHRRHTTTGMRRHNFIGRTKDDPRGQSNDEINRTQFVNDHGEKEDGNVDDGNVDEPQKKRQKR